VVIQVHMLEQSPLYLFSQRKQEEYSLDKFD